MRLNIDKLLAYTTVVFGVVLIVSQLLISFTKYNGQIFGVNENNYSVYTSSELLKDDLFEITFSVKDSLTEEIYILENGDQIGVMLNDSVTIAFKNNSVIEIDGRNINKEFYIYLEGNTQSLPQKVLVKNNITMVGRILKEKN